MHESTKTKETTTKLLRTFLLLLENNTSDTATKLNVTQGAVSQNLKKLRDTFGDELFKKDDYSKFLIPTAKARSIAPSIRTIVSMFDATVSEHDLNDFDYSKSDKHFVICANSYFETIAYRLADHLHNVAPGVTLEIRSSERGTTQTMQGYKCDILVDQIRESNKHLAKEKLLDDEWVVICSESNREIEGLSITPEVYYALTHVTASNGYDVKNSKLKKAVITPSFINVVELVSKTSHIATIPKKIAKAHSKTLRLRYLPCPVELEPISLYMFYEGNTLTPSNKWLQKVIRNCFAEI